MTDLDADLNLVSRPVTPGSAADLGNRMILAPVSLNPNLSDEAIRVLARQFSIGDRDGDDVPDSRPVNVVVLVPSVRAAGQWHGYADQVYTVGDLEVGVAALRAGHVGLVVMVNKYDGIDLPGSACELLVLDGVPQPLDGWERREAAALEESQGRKAREVQRIEQGMGRGVRHSEDHCAVLLLGAQLAQATYDKQYLDLFSPATKAQLALSREVASQIRGEGLDGIRAALHECLEQSADWVTASRRALADVQYAEVGIVRPEAIAGRQAFDLAASNQTRSAADVLQAAINKISEPSLRGWLLEQEATYLHFTDPGEAQSALASAGKQNKFVLRPVAGIKPVRVRALAAQGKAAAEYLSAEYADSMALVLGVKALLADIDWDNDRVEQAEAAWRRLGLHLGFASTRPEAEEGVGPDNLWAMAGDILVPTELKTGAVATTISKGYVDQLGGSARWAANEYPGAQIVPVMVHPSSTVEKDGTPPPGTRIVTKTGLESLKDAVTKYAVALADGQGRWRDEQAVAGQLGAFKLTPGQIFQTYGVSTLSAG